MSKDPALDDLWGSAAAGRQSFLPDKVPVLKSYQRPNSASHMHARAIPNGVDQNVGWMKMGVVAVMAKVIQFYVPDKLRERRSSNPPGPRGKVIQFPPAGNCTCGKLASPHLHREH
jgi:hypothetical protein